MTVTDVVQDPENLTLTLTARFAATDDQVWRMWADPRLLERWWGPPTYPATFIDHDLTPGGGVSYYMTSPEGEKYHGWWRIRRVEPPRAVEFEDGFADDAGRPDPKMPTMTVRVSVGPHAESGTEMVIESTFPTADAMERLLRMGMQEGLTGAVGQIDALLEAA